MHYVLTEEEYLTLRKLANEALTPTPPFFEVKGPITLARLDKFYVQKILGICNGNHSEAARMLDVHRQTVNSILNNS